MTEQQLKELYFDLDETIRRLAMMGFDTTSMEREKEDIRLKWRSKYLSSKGEGLS